MKKTSFFEKIIGWKAVVIFATILFVAILISFRPVAWFWSRDLGIGESLLWFLEALLVTSSIFVLSLNGFYKIWGKKFDSGVYLLGFLLPVFLWLIYFAIEELDMVNMSGYAISLYYGILTFGVGDALWGFSDAISRVIRYGRNVRVALSFSFLFLVILPVIWGLIATGFARLWNKMVK